MTKLVLTPMATKYEDTGRGYIMEVSSFMIGSGPEFPREEVDCKKLADVRAAVAAYGARVAEAMPDWSFKVSVYPARGERKMAGFDAALRGGDYLGAKAWIQTVVRGAA